MRATGNRIKSISKAIAKQSPPDHFRVYLSWYDPELPEPEPLTEPELKDVKVIKLTWGDDQGQL
jgi:hypothetical protein